MTERETEVGSTFRFIPFHFCLHVVFKQTLPKTNRSFHDVSSCAEFCCAMQCCKMQCVCAVQNNLKGH